MTKTVCIQRDAYDEYRVPGPDATEAQAYYTDDPRDARDTAKAMHGQAVKIRIRRVEEFTRGFEEGEQ